MRIKIKYILLCIVIGSIGNMLFAQDVSKVDVSSVPQSDIRKALKKMQDAGLSPTEAANLARQRGATEEQIQEFLKRAQESPSSNSIEDVAVDSVQVSDEQINTQKQAQLDMQSTTKDTLTAEERVFGSDLFNSKNLTFEPSLYIQTPNNYEIGIGDQILISIWGNSQSNYQLVVNRSGQIIIPDVGPIYIAGLSFEEAERKIKNRLTSIYSDMRGKNPETFAQINMGQLRSIQVNLVGDVSVPGTYTLPVTSTVFNALYLSGGPGAIGSFRNIKIIRANKVFKTIDIYDFLINADPSANINLKDQDIIFIPPVEKRVKITGEFKRNGLFEMKEGENLDKLIRFAGGFKDDSYILKLQIRRKGVFKYQIIDVPLQEAVNTVLKNGDEVRNGKIMDIFENRVTISGAVYRPGDYEWKKGLSLKELILKADSLTDDAFITRGIITRNNEDLSTSKISFNVQEVLDGDTKILLEPEDLVQIKSHFSLKEQPYITVSGEVLSPGQFMYSDNLTLGDVIFMANGFTEAADSSYIEVSRRLSYDEASKLTDIFVHIYRFSLARNMQLDETDASFVIEPFDRISVKRAPGYAESVSVEVRGEVKYAGVYAVRDKKQRISDLISMAGGFTDNSFLKGAKFSRKTEELGIENLAIDLENIVKYPGSEKDLFLRDGDVLSIPQEMQTVKVVGNVQNPFSLTYEKGKSLKYYVDQAGGFNSKAFKRKVYVQYPNGATASTNSLIFNDYPKVLPGSLIVIPEKPPREGGLSTGEVISLSSALSSMALVIVSIVNVLSN